MKEIKLYKCEMCGTSYSQKVDCQKCEKGHRKPKSVCPSKYLPISQDATGYPKYVDVEMDNGKTVRYEKKREVQYYEQ